MKRICEGRKIKTRHQIKAEFRASFLDKEKNFWIGDITKKQTEKLEKYAANFGYRLKEEQSKFDDGCFCDCEDHVDVFVQKIED